MRLSLMFALVSQVFFFIGCAKIEETTEENGADASISAGVAALTGAVHTLNTQSGTLSRTVSACGTPAAADTACANGTKTASYSSCAAAGGQTYSGSIQLSFSDTATCSVDDNGDKVTRTLNVTRVLQFADFTRFNGTSVQTTSESHTTFNGLSLGGGVRLTQTGATDVDFEVLGIHKVLTSSRGKKLYDISVRTPVPFTMVGDRSGDRTLMSGTLEVVHNQAQYSVNLTTSDLRYNSTTCCHPISGTLSATFDGRVVGSGTVSFSSTCGLASLQRDGTTTELALHGCE